MDSDIITTFTTFTTDSTLANARNTNARIRLAGWPGLPDPNYHSNQHEESNGTNANSYNFFSARPVYC